MQDRIDELCALAGIERVYFDQFGTRREVGAETVHAIAHVLGLEGHANEARPPDTALDTGDAPPSHAFLPAALREDRGIWGFAVQLYALRSSRDWGIGDFGSLAELITRAAGAGASAVGLNPLHALYLDEPERASPYSPSSRIFLNPLYIDVPAIPEFSESGAAQAVDSPAFQAQLGRLRECALIDYPGVASAKLRILETLHASFHTLHLARRTARGREFAEFLRAEGEPLHRFAIFHAIRESRGGQDPAQRYWRHWPDELRDPVSAAVADFAAAHAERIEFVAYLQWIARQQLAACAAAARRADMAIGLYTDLAVGVDGGAGEAWANQEIVVAGWSLGAPPDNWNSRGQDWGLAPINPVALKRGGFRNFAALLRANMACAGALRIDHILGLWRAFWIRHGTDPGQGAYLRYPFADLLPVLVRESHRARCAVIGEDLGTVPAGLREALDGADILGCRVFLFERHADGSFRRPREYTRNALVSVSTHDLPTFPGYWRGADLELRARLGFFPEPGRLAHEHGQRAADRARLADALRDEGLIEGGVPDAPPVEAVYRFLARTPARLLMVQLEDALGLTEQVNVPGTTDEHPNWRRRLPCDVEAIFADARVKALSKALAHERPRPVPA